MTEDITYLLKAVRTGDMEAQARLLPLIQDQLRVIASRYMRRERRDHTLQTTALVHEAYIQLLAERPGDWKDRAHFFSVAAQVMRHILVDYARSRLAGRRGGGAVHMPFDDALVCSDDRLEQLIYLEEALGKLEQDDPRAVQVVVLRFYSGMNLEEIAEALQVSPRTIKRDWNFAKAWLRNELSA